MVLAEQFWGDGDKVEGGQYRRYYDSIRITSSAAQPLGQAQQCRASACEEKQGGRKEKRVFKLTFHKGNFGATYNFETHFLCVGT